MKWSLFKEHHTEVVKLVVADVIRHPQTLFGGDVEQRAASDFH